VARKLRSKLLVGGGLTAAAALVVTLPGAASAAAALNYDQAVTGSTSTDYDVNTSTRVWSVVSVRSSAGSDFDLNVSDGPTSYISQRSAGTDFVLIDSSLDAHGPATYPTRITRFSSGGRYSAIHSRAHSVITRPTNPRPSSRTNVFVTTRTAPVTLVPIRLKIDEGFRVKFPVGTTVLLTRSFLTPVPPFVENRAQVEQTGLLGGGRVSGAWVVGDSTTGGCAAFGSPDGTDDWILVLIDDQPMGSAGKIFNLYSYDRWNDPQNQC